MKVTGLITEYNPFHNGHAYHIEMAREITGADYIIVVMSGDFVQRGTPAMIQKYARTKMALLGGADLVLELPVQYATATAETFAYGGVKILNELGIVDHICFGSESGNASILMEIADILVNEPAWYSSSLKEHLKNGMSFPAARAAALPKYQDILSEPNNILGIEYCKALLRLNSNITPITIKRQGAGYHDTQLDSFASASGIRNCIKQQQLIQQHNDTNISELQRLIPENAFSVLNIELEENGFVSEDDFSQLLFYKLLQLHAPEELFHYLDMSEELANRIFKRRYDFQTFSQFADLLKTKEITRTRINRALLHFLLDIHKADTNNEVYGRILGFKKSTATLLSQIKANAALPLISKSAQAENLLTENQKNIFARNVEASNIYEMLLSQKNNRPFIHEYQKQMILL